MSTVLITGAGRGIGRGLRFDSPATAGRFSRECAARRTASVSPRRGHPSGASAPARDPRPDRVHVIGQRQALDPLDRPYNGSKFALEGLADSLRIELRPWGIKVILVEPASTDTDLWRDALNQLDRTEAGLGADHRRLYAGHLVGIRRTTKVIEKQAVPREDVVDVVEKALTARRPRARYPVGVLSKVQLALGAVTPTPVMDVSLARLTGVPRKP